VAALIAGQLDLARAWLARIVDCGRAVGAVRTDLPGELLLTMLAAAGEAADRWFVINRERLDPGDADRLALALFDALRRLAEPAKPPDRRAS
jgi:hypothetical protein